MAEDGCTLNEMQTQSGHKSIPVLLGYIQHTPQRIRKAYERVFEGNDELLPEIKKPKSPDIEDVDYYKKLAFQRYLNGEIDTETLNTMLQAFDNGENTKNHKKDLAYL